MEENEKIYNNQDIILEGTCPNTKKSIKDILIDNSGFIFFICSMCVLIYILFFNSNNEPKPQINKYDLVEFTTEQNKKSYTDVIPSESNDKYIKYIFIDKNNGIQIDKIKDNSFTDIKLIETTNKPFIEIETIEKRELFIIDTSKTIYTLHLPKEDIETLKNKM